MEKLLELSPKQIEYVQNAHHRWNIKIGATQCGKTHIDICYSIPSRIMERAGKKGLNVILGVTKESIERNILEPMRELWGTQLVGQINSRNVCKMFGERVYCLGAEKVSQVAKMRGSRIKYLYIDEIVDIHEDVFSLIKSRLSLEYSICDAAGNPGRPDHPIKKFTESDADVYCQEWTLYDNPFLPESYVKALETEYAGTVWFMRYVLGKWALAEGLVYPMFNDDFCVVKTIARPYEQYYLSMDYGIQNATAIGLWGLSNGIWYMVKEYYHSGRESNDQKTDNEYYDEIVKLVGNIKIRQIIIDPSAASLIVLIRRKGQFGVRQADNAVLDGIRETAVALKQGLIKFNDCCTHAIREFVLYSWDDKSTEDAPIKDNDHHMDEIRYFVKTLNIAVPKRKSLLDREG